MEEKKVHVDPMGYPFAKVMTISTIIGIVLMIVPGIAYFAGINPYVPLNVASEYWGNSTVNFWINVKGESVHGYGWIFENLQYTDCMSMLGVIVLMLTPLFSMIASIPKADKIFKVLLVIAIVEFIVAIIVKGAF